jgi:hypothetical protein
MESDTLVWGLDGQFNLDVVHFQGKLLPLLHKLDPAVQLDDVRYPLSNAPIVRPDVVSRDLFETEQVQLFLVFIRSEVVGWFATTHDLRTDRNGSDRQVERRATRTAIKILFCEPGL